MILKFEQTKQALKFELDQLINKLEAEEKNERDTMNWSGEGNNRMVWRIKPESARNIKKEMIDLINRTL